MKRKYWKAILLTAAFAAVVFFRGTMVTHATWSGPDDVVYEIPAEEILITDSDLPDSEILFAGYVDSLFEEVLPDNGYSRPYFAARRAYLAENEWKVYDALKARVSQVAAGTLDDTFFIFNTAEFLGKTTFTYAELGLSAGAEGTAIQNAVYARIGDLQKIHSHIMLDSPYEFYWFDKTKTGGLGSSRPGIRYNSTSIFVDETFYMAYRVAKEYSATGTAGTTKTNKTVTAAAAKARTNAAAIVAKYAALGDTEKLTAYRDEICKAVEYDNDAASDSSTPYGNPWQLIWVFDGNPATKVVCEGYSKAFKLLCDMSAFKSYRTECHIMTGTTLGNHMWNVVCMDNGRNYLVDLTNADAGDHGNDTYFLRGAPNGTADSYLVNIRYTYDASCKKLFTEKERRLSTGNSYAEDMASSAPEEEDVHVTQVRLDRTSANLIKGKTVQLKAEVRPAHATNQKITFSSDKPAVATVSDTGLVTAKAAGTAVITAKSEDGGKTATCKLTVTVPVTGVTVNPANVKLDYDQTVQLSYTVAPADATDKTVSFASDNTTVATVSATGLVTAKKPGSANITVTTKDGGKTAVCKVVIDKRIGWFQAGSNWMYYYDSGEPARGCWEKVGDTWYSFDDAGIMRTGWLQEGDIWYYLEDWGGMATGWVKVGYDWYYMYGSGAMAAGWIWDAGRWYYLCDWGNMVTGWLWDNGVWYYMADSGEMATGWVLDNGVWYYMDGSGAMLADTGRFIKDKYYNFNASGACTNPY